MLGNPRFGESISTGNNSFHFLSMHNKEYGPLLLATDKNSYV